MNNYFVDILKSLNLKNICKSRNGESGNGMRGMMGMRKIRVGMHRIRRGGDAGNHGGNAGNRGGNVLNARKVGNGVGMRRIRMGMRGIG